MALNSQVVPKVADQIAQNMILKRLYLFALLVSDTVMLVLAFALAYWLRFEVGIGIDLLIEPDLEHYWQILPSLIPLWLVFFFLSQLYDFRYLLEGRQEYFRAFNACMSGMMLVVLATFIQPNFDIARAWLLMLWLLATFFVITSRFILRRIAYAYQLRHKGEMVEPHLTALQDSNSSVRQAAAEALGQIGDPRAVEPLVLSLSDENGEVRRAVAEALGQIGDPRAIEPLLFMLGDKDRSERRAVQEVLAQYFQKDLKKENILIDILAFALARIEGVSDDVPLEVDVAYNLLAGVLQEKHNKFAVHNFREDDYEVIDIDITVRASGFDISPNWHQRVKFIRGRDSGLVEFTLVPKEIGARKIEVEFIYERHWLTAVVLNVSVIEPDLVGKQLYTRLLASQSLGESLLETRQLFWQQERNPSGLLYAMRRLRFG